jgi:glycosyltransferase involved in cell wall biosynthesis
MDDVMINKLAVIIPYFKPTFFRQALLSIKNQTHKGFHVYIGDDFSPDDPTEIIKDIFGDAYDANVTYHKFSSNLGGISLTKQWERCIDLASEQYVWLFSDDDIMAEDCVERFYNFIDKYPDADLLRFNVKKINDENVVITEGPDHPLHETSLSFLNRRLLGSCLSAACEYVFKKEIYIRHAGFVEFPLAWAADDATWINYGSNTGIYTIPGKEVLWRFGNFNISSDTKNYQAKAKACLLFVNFVQTKYPTINKLLLLNWLWLQLFVLNYSSKMKIGFFYELIYRRLFSFIDVLRFVKHKLFKTALR